MNDGDVRIIKPEALKAKDRVAVIAPSSAVSEEAAGAAKACIKAIGLEPVM